MLHLILFLSTQLLTITYSNSLKPMAPAASEIATTTTTTSTTTTTTPASTTTQNLEHTEATSATAPDNNVLLFLNECTDDPSDDLLSNIIMSMMLRAKKAHCIAPLTSLKKALKALRPEDPDTILPKDDPVLHLCASVYFVNDSPYCIIIPQKDNYQLQGYDQSAFLDLSESTPLCTPDCLREDNEQRFFGMVLERIEQTLERFSLLEQDAQKKESAVLRQLFKKQIKAHDLFAAEPQGDESVYTPENYKLATQPWHFYFCGHGYPKESAAGFAFSSGELWKTLKFLNHISTGYLIMLSCHSGGENREILTGRYNLTPENFPPYKKLVSIIDSLATSYKIILCSPASVPAKTVPRNITETINTLTESHLTDAVVTKILGNASRNLSTYAQINQLPLIQRPHHTSFTPFLPRSPEKYSSLVLDTTFHLTATAQHIHARENKDFFIEDKSVIQSDQAIITQALKINPLTNFKKLKSELIEQEIVHGYGHEDKHLQLFPVVSDTVRKTYHSTDGDEYELSPSYPFFLSLQPETAYHYFNAIHTGKTENHLPGEQGVFLCLRDLFFNANRRNSTNLYFIKNIVGQNDIPQHVIDKQIFGENFPQEGDALILSNIVLVTFCEAKTHYLFGAFSREQEYYSFSLKIENAVNEKEWACIRQLPSKEDFETMVCSFEEFACSKIYDHLASYPASHPQHELIKQYLNGEKSIFLDFENSYPLFKDDHLPEDNRAWEKLPELLEKHAEKQKNPSLIAQHQQENQETFAPALNKLKEYQLLIKKG